MTYLDLQADPDVAHPVDAIETIAGVNDWEYERDSADEIVITTRGAHTTYTVAFTWLDEISSLHVSCTFELGVPGHRHTEVTRLLRRINEQLWLGHFDMWEDDKVILYRHSHVLGATDELSHDVAQMLLQSALSNCDMYYQAFHFVVWAGQSAEQAMQATMFETVGEA